MLGLVRLHLNNCDDVSQYHRMLREFADAAPDSRTASSDSTTTPEKPTAPLSRRCGGQRRSDQPLLSRLWLP